MSILAVNALAVNVLAVDSAAYGVSHTFFAGLCISRWILWLSGHSSLSVLF